MARGALLSLSAINSANPNGICQANCKSNGNTHMQNLTGRTAFVTGAASGIGLGIATALSQAGVKVMLCDIEEEALATAVEKLKLTNADVDGVRADVSLKAELQAAADATAARYGRVHILVNNAGVGGGRGYGHWTDAGWNWVLGVNLMSVIWGIEIFGPLIEAHGEGGQIVSTASVSGLIAGPNPGYDVSKYGVVALSEGLRKVLAPRKIGVSVLCPGVIRTQIMNSRRNVPQRSFRRRRAADGRTARRVHQGASGTDQQWHRSALCRRTGSRGNRK